MESGRPRDRLAQDQAVIRPGESLAGIRLQKFLAEAGVASRRAAERMILAGQVAVNGSAVRVLGTRVDPASDRVEVAGQIVARRRRKFYIALHKPPGFLCTRRDSAGRRRIHDLLPLEWKDLYSVGRLDRDSEGLMFLTNDGEFCLKLTHPRYGVSKKYRVTVAGKVELPALAPLRAGIMDEGERLQAAAARLVSHNHSQSILEIEMREGKKREIRRLCAARGWTVIRLQRVQVGPIKLGELPPGKWRTLTAGEIKSLLEFL